MVSILLIDGDKVSKVRRKGIIGRSDLLPILIKSSRGNLG